MAEELSLGRRGYVHSPTGELLAVLNGWELSQSQDLQVVKSVDGPDPVVDPADWPDACRVSLLLDNSIMSGMGEVDKSVAPWTWRGTIVDDIHALDGCQVPPIGQLDLPNGQKWFIRYLPRYDRLERALTVAMMVGHETPDSFVELAAAYDAGWTLSMPSPNDLTTETWDLVPREVIEAFADYIVAQKASGAILLPSLFPPTE